MQNTNPSNDFLSDDSYSFLSSTPQTLHDDTDNHEIASSTTPTEVESQVFMKSSTFSEQSPAQNEPKEDTPMVDDSTVPTAQLISTIHTMKDQLDSMLKILSGQPISVIKNGKPKIHTKNFSSNERIVEGVFNGEQMVGPDGEEFSIPANYASKSKLVEGDLMKLTISHNGSFIYKQTSPVVRKRLVGELISNSENGHWNAIASGRTYQLLTASVTFFKGKPGDEVILLVPEDGQSSWAAVENVINK